MIIFNRRGFISVVAALACGLVTGCGTGDDLPRERVSGTVKFDGKPLATGTISFLPTAADAPGTGSLVPIVEGSYEVPLDKGLVPGPYRVVISRTEEGAQPTNPQPGDGDAPIVKELIPAKYNRETKLKADVAKGGENVFDFALDAK